MRKARVGLIMLLVGILALCAGFGLAESKEEGFLSVNIPETLISTRINKEQEGYYLYTSKDKGNGYMDWDTRENVTSASVEFISGDERLKDILSIENDEEGAAIRYVVPPKMESATGTWLVKGESEHYIGQKEITVKVVPSDELKFELLKDVIEMNEGETLEAYSLKGNVLTSEFDNYRVTIKTPGFQLTERKDMGGYILASWGNEFTAVKAGNYEMEILAQSYGSDYTLAKYTVTIHVLSDEELNAQWEPWPPAGKKKAEANRGLAEELGGVYLVNFENDERFGTWSNSTPLNLHPEENYTTDVTEKITRGRVTFLSGDEELKNFFNIDVNDSRLRWIDTKYKDLEGEATFRIDLESESYWYSAEFTVTTMDSSKVDVQINFDAVDTYEGYNGSCRALLDQSLIQITPEIKLHDLYLTGEDGTREVDRDEYTLSWDQLYANVAGDYPVYLELLVGVGPVHLAVPTTLHIGEAAEAEAEWAENWPPKGKQETTAYNPDSAYWNGYFVIREDNPGEFGDYLRLYPNDQKRWDEGEEITDIHVTFVGGEEGLKKVLSGSYYGEPVPSFDFSKAKAMGQAEFRIDAQSENYYTSFNMRPTFISEKDVEAEQLVTEITVPVGEMAWVSDLSEQVPFFAISPEMGYYCNFRLLDDEYTNHVENDQYIFNSGYVQPQKAGDYEFGLEVYMGSGVYSRNYTITIHAVEGISYPIVHTQAEDIELTPTPVPTPEPTPVPEGSGVTADGFAYEAGWNNRTIKITGGPDVEELVIPGEIDGKTVSSVDGFENHRNIKKLVISEGVTEIEGYAFQGCTALEEVVLPDSLTRIRYSAFEDCHSLTTVSFGTGLTASGIDDEAFNGIAAEDLSLSDGTSLAAITEDNLYLDQRYPIVRISTYGGDWNYLVLKDGSARITDWNNYGDTVEIPAEIDGHPVTELNGRLMNGRSVRSVTLPESLRTIGRSAFEDCVQLKNINLPESVTWIGKRAFVNIAKKDLEVSGEMEHLPAFWYSHSKTTDATGEWEYEILPDEAAVLTNWLGEGKELVVPQEVDGRTVRIYADSSYEDTDFTSLVLPDTLEIIEERAFVYFEKLTKLTLPANLKEIGEEAFYGLKVKKLELPEGLTVIDDKAFYNTSLSEIVFPESLQYIGNAAFNMTEIKKATFNGYDTRLGVGIFGYITNGFGAGYDDPSTWRDVHAVKTGNTDKLTVVCYPGSTADTLYTVNVTKQYLKFGEETKVTAPEGKVLTKEALEGIRFISELTIPEGVEEIAEDALAGYSMMTRITLPATLKKIGDRAFQGCSNLTEIKLGKNVEEIGEEAFSGCIKLKTMALPAGVTEIKYGTFFRCSALTSVTLPKGLTSIGDGAFMMSGIKTLKMPDTVTKLGEMVFYGCESLSSATLSKGLTEVPKLSFGSSSITSVTIPEGVTVIRDRAFYDCAKLSQVKLPKSLEIIETQAFAQDVNYVRSRYSYYRKAGATALKSISLPANLVSIGENAFADCDMLATVTFAKGSQLQSIGDNAFADNLSLKQIEIPDSVTEIGSWVFMNGIKLTKVNLGAGLTKIGEHAFAYCDGLTSLTAPDTLTEIGTDLLDGHGAKLVVTCGEGSAMETYLTQNYPDVTVKYPKTKK